ncbi:deoxyribonuclease TatD [Neokomagataea thailandica NBRC 106555]|uniref:TatD family deoxyribonuclease n=2 Tax=Neokomagataea TaxID=1223423 RepID=A0A4Y6V6I4_9PROT|nr:MULTISPECIES: TatD family hydrolase [Neokomagataea]QDH23935.1 TatD family deoxyribonuclease [Neokomagataea tanensis]GBR54508.1 deoxyribonuclease TatD [Neokomagataea thailandica NBRC 106555]
MTGLIDTHCHLDRLTDVDAALNLAREHGLSGVVTIGTRFSEAEKQIGLLQYDRPDLRVWCAIGTHPDHVLEEPEITVSDIVERCSVPGIVAIGESGLDYFHGAEEVRPAQAASFRTHIAAARETGLPLVIHTRQADDDTIAILEDETRKGAFPFLIHCFASGPKLARAAVAMGGYVSFSGLFTFPKCGEIREAARGVPDDRILVETDSPFLAPVPKRGKPNTPAYVSYTAEHVARERGVSLEELTKITTDNARRLFRRMTP